MGEALSDGDYLAEFISHFINSSSEEKTALELIEKLPDHSIKELINEHIDGQMFMLTEGVKNAFEELQSRTNFRSNVWKIKKI